MSRATIFIRLISIGANICALGGGFKASLGRRAPVLSGLLCGVSRAFSSAVCLASVLERAAYGFFLFELFSWLAPNGLLASLLAGHTVTSDHYLERFTDRCHLFMSDEC